MGMPRSRRCCGRVSARRAIAIGGAGVRPRPGGRHRPWPWTGRTRGPGRSAPGSRAPRRPAMPRPRSGRTRLTVQPPKPAPVIRAATTPGTRGAISTIASSSGETTSNRSRSDAWLAANSPRPRRDRPPQGGDGLATRAFSVTTCSARRQATGSIRVARRRQVDGVTSRSDGSPGRPGRSRRRRPRTGSPHVVLRAVEGARRAGVADDEADVPGAARPAATRASGSRAGRPSRPPRTTPRTGP